MQAHNWRTVLQTIRLHGPLSRADMARSSGLSLPTISAITKELVNEGLVLEVGQRQTRRGKPPVDYAINPVGVYSIGLKLDRDQLVAVLINLAGEVEQRRQIELGLPGPGSDLPRPPQEMLGLLEGIVTELLAAAAVPTKRVWGVGLGLPGPLRMDGKVAVGVAYPEASAWNDVPVVAELTRRLGLPVYLTGNAMAAAIGELLYGNGYANPNFLYFFFGVSGSGSALILNGQPYSGALGNAGSLAFPPLLPVSLDTDGPSITEIENFGLLHLYQSLAASGVVVSTVAELERLHRQASPPLFAWLNRLVAHLHPLLDLLDTLLNLNAVILGGRLPVVLTDYLVERLRAGREVLGKETGYMQVCAAQAGQNAAAIGLGALSIHKVLAPERGLRSLARNGNEPVNPNG